MRPTYINGEQSIYSRVYRFRFSYHSKILSKLTSLIIVIGSEINFLKPYIISLKITKGVCSVIEC